MSQCAPILYSFRRCPYAMRARLALRYSGIQVELREVVLRDKPTEMLTLSPKGTVPVLQGTDGRVIDESWDIMLWALQQHDPNHWLPSDASTFQQTARWVALNDHPFKACLDRYKYADRYPAHPAAYFRDQTGPHLWALSAILERQPCLAGEQPGLLDYALLPFVRQFAHVDKPWFDRRAPRPLVDWLEGLLAGDLFQRVMNKHPQWVPGQAAVWL